MLCHVPSIGSCSQLCLILQPHRVAVPFPPTFASPWRNSFVQIHGGTTLLKTKFGTTPQKLPKNDLNWGVGSSYGTNNPPFQTHRFPMKMWKQRKSSSGCIWCQDGDRCPNSLRCPRCPHTHRSRFNYFSSLLSFCKRGFNWQSPVPSLGLSVTDWKLLQNVTIATYNGHHRTLTENQLGAHSGRQIHNAIYCLISIIQYNISQKGLATYVAFDDFSSAFPSIHRGKLLFLPRKENIVGRMWKHLRERLHIVKVRVLHPQIPSSSSVDILRGGPEGSRLRPTLFGIFVADLIHELKVQFPNTAITHSGGVRWIRGIL